MNQREIISIVPKRGIYHHTADASPENQTDKINAVHKARGFPLSNYGFYIGYHYLITREGFRLSVRPRNEMGAHDQGENFDSIGVAFMNDFNINKPNPAEEMAMAQLVDESIRELNFNLLSWEPHRKNDTTDCPGKNIPENWAQLCYLRYKVSWLQRILLWLKYQI